MKDGRLVFRNFVWLNNEQALDLFEIFFLLELVRVAEACNKCAAIS